MCYSRIGGNRPMKEALRRFKYPYGRKRSIAPWDWEWRDRILVLGELLAFGAAIAAIPVELAQWTFAPWLVIAATIIGTSALLWYAFDLISAGKTPLTDRSAHTIRQVVSAVEMEKQGAVFDWDVIDERGGIQVDFSKWSGLRPDLKAIMDEFDVPLLVAVQISSAREQERRQG